MGAVDTITSRLRGENVPFEVHHHPLAYTAQHVAQSEHVPGRMVAKVVVVFADGRLALVVVPAPAHVSLEKAASAIKAREVRLASEEEMAAAFPEWEVGATPPIGSAGLVVCVDKELVNQERIIFQAGTHTDTVAMACEDYLKVVHPVVADVAVRPAQ